MYAVYLYPFLPICRVRSGTSVTTIVPAMLLLRRFPQELQLKSA